MKFAILLTALLALCSCARQFRYSGTEAGRVAAYFRMDEAEVSRIYEESAFSWLAAVRRLIEEKTLSSAPAPEDFPARFEEEAAKIMLECGIE